MRKEIEKEQIFHLDWNREFYFHFDFFNLNSSWTGMWMSIIWRRERTSIQNRRSKWSNVVLFVPLFKLNFPWEKAVDLFKSFLWMPFLLESIFKLKLIGTSHISSWRYFQLESWKFNSSWILEEFEVVNLYEKRIFKLNSYWIPEDFFIVKNIHSSILNFNLKILRNFQSIINCPSSILFHQRFCPPKKITVFSIEEFFSEKEIV